jgi:glutamyl-tRNA synthetase
MMDTENQGQHGIISTTDLIRGHVSFKTELLDDKILFKSDGMPTYHLANIVDDHLMEISHVIRGEEWLPSLPLHIALYNAFGWKIPEFAHLPLILKPVGKGKLSKRDGDKLGFPVFPLEYKNMETGEISKGYKEDGYFADAFINMLALLGWNPGTEQELFTLEELSTIFSLERVSKSGAKFNPDKTKWFNQQYMHKKTNAELATLFTPILTEKNVIANEMKQSQNLNRLPRHYAPRNDKELFNNDYIEKVISLVKDRAVFVHDFWNLSSFFFVAPTEYDAKASKKNWKEGTPELMEELITCLKSIKDFTSLTIENTIKEWITSKEIGFGKVMQPFRLSLVGAMKGPHLFDIAEMIGKEETINRINKAIATL